MGQSIAVLRGVHNGLGKKEDILSNAQVVNVEKVRSSLGQKSPTLIGRHRRNMHQIYFTWHRSVFPRYRYFFSSNGCPCRGSTNASHTPLPVLWASGRLQALLLLPHSADYQLHGPHLHPSASTCGPSGSAWRQLMLSPSSS
jgi:hypothetical protein